MQMPHPRQRIWRFPPQKDVDSSPKKVRKKQKKTNKKRHGRRPATLFRPHGRADGRNWRRKPRNNGARRPFRSSFVSSLRHCPRPINGSFHIVWNVPKPSTICSVSLEHLGTLFISRYSKKKPCADQRAKTKEKRKKTVKQKKNDTADRKFPLGGTKSKIPVSLLLFFFLLYQRRHWRHFRFTASRRRVCVSFLFYFIFLRRSLRRRCGRPPSAPKKNVKIKKKSKKKSEK